MKYALIILSLYTTNSLALEGANNTSNNFTQDVPTTDNTFIKNDKKVSKRNWRSFLKKHNKYVKGKRINK